MHDTPSTCWVCVGQRDRADRRGGLVDGVNRSAGEVAIAHAGSAERIAGGIDDRIVIDQVQSQRAVAGAGIDGHDVHIVRAEDAANRAAGDRSRGYQEKVGLVHARDILTERDSELNAGGIGRIDA